MAETRIQVVGSSASSQEPAYLSSWAFNDVTAPQSWWQTQAWHLTNEWVAGHLASAQVVNRIRYFASALISKNIKHAKFEGSNDGGASWTKIPASAWAQGASQYNGDEILFAHVEGWQEVTLYNSTAYSRYRLFCYDSYKELSGAQYGWQVVGGWRLEWEKYYPSKEFFDTKIISGLQYDRNDLIGDVSMLKIGDSIFCYGGYCDGYHEIVNFYLRTGYTYFDYVTDIEVADTLGYSDCRGLFKYNATAVCRADYSPPGTEYYDLKYVTDLCTLPQFNKMFAIDPGYADKFPVGQIFQVIDSWQGNNDGYYTVVSAHNHDSSMDPWNGGWLGNHTIIEVAELIPDNEMKGHGQIKKTTLLHTCVDSNGVDGWWGQLHMAVAELEFYEWDGVPSPPSPPPDPLPSLISHWKMNDNVANKIVVDSVGINTGTAQQNTSVLHTAGKINGALTFNGSSDYINCGSDPSLNIINPMSICAWIKLSNYSLDINTGYIIGHSYITPGFRGYIFSIKGGDTVARPMLRLMNGIVGESEEALSDENLELGQWYHIVGTVDSTTIKIYVNGILKNSQIYSITPLASNKLVIGKANWYGELPDTYFDGAIDDIRIYNQTLMLNEIEALYNGGIGTEGPVPYVIKHDFKCYSEGETKMQKSFSLRFEAKKDTSLESALAREIDPVLNLIDKTQIRIYARAIRTGSNFSIEFRNSNDYIITHTPNIKETYKWQSEAIDISKIANADKNSLNQVKTKIVNADEDNIFWLDNILVK